MLFNSWTFAIFLAITFLVYHFAPWPGRAKVIGQLVLLTLASYVFYAWHTPWLVVVLGASTWINAWVTIRLLDARVSGKNRWWLLFFAVVSNLAVLGFFKYASLLVESFFPNSWWSQWGFDLTEIPLPVGISFYTFQGISLVVDIYRAGPGGMDGVPSPQTTRDRWNLGLRVSFFKAFFPQLVAGPIVKAHEFMFQIRAKSLRDVEWDPAIRNLILGYFLKMVVADNLKEATAGLSYPAFVGTPGINLLFLLYGYSFQIFADFAGYSLIAIGLARLFGYELPANFNFPYIARSITEFWRRWHISLSTWLREYLYFPLGGNRKGPVRTYLNLIVVMLLGGLWHGAAWSYMVWGGAHGLFLAIERFFGIKGFAKAAGQPVRRATRFTIAAFQILLTFHLVSLLWLLFQLPRFHEAILYLRELAAWKPGLQPQPIFTILIFGTPVVLYHLLALLRQGMADEQSQMSEPRDSPPAIRHSLSSFARDVGYAILLFLILTNSGSPGEFIYFQF